VRSLTAVAVVTAASLGLACGGEHGKRTVRIAAASDLVHAFQEVGREFEAKTGIEPIFDFRSSGLLAKQISEGAPFALFAAASREYVDQVVASGRCDAKSVASYARGRVVVWTPNGVVAPTKLSELSDPRFERISIANPDHAPYGKAAKQALVRAGLWDQLENRIVVGDSVQSTMQYAQSRSVQAAIVAQSLASVTEGGAFLPVDPALYDPLEQSLVVCGGGDESDAARQFVEYLESPAGHEVMTRYGFVSPDGK
jgi:molybdate transport system substrate-binding protein